MRTIGNHPTYDKTIFACDVGGTNTSVAAVGRLGRSFSIIRRFRYKSQAISGLTEALGDARNHLETDGIVPTSISICGAGPIRDGRCTLSNVPWIIDREAVSAAMSLPTLLINDFSGVSYGIPLLNTSDSQQIVPISHPDGTVPEPGGNVRAVVGAGTGLGVGYLVEVENNIVAMPSEGGHSAFSPWDTLSSDLADHVAREAAPPLRDAPGWELFVSGRGIVNTFSWVRSRAGDKGTPLPDAAAIASAADEGDPLAAEAMRTFVANYARFAGAAALHFLPEAGLYLAGGIVTKNVDWFLRDNLFIREFLRNYREHIRGVLGRVPVYVVRDYDVSLYGAAHAAWVHGMEG